MKIPVCNCGHTLAVHAHDDGKLWQRDGFCTHGYYKDGRFRGYGSGCPCPEFQYGIDKLPSVPHPLGGMEAPA